MLSLAIIYTLYFRLYFRLCICLNKLSINQSAQLKIQYVFKIKIKNYELRNYHNNTINRKTNP